MDEEKKKPRIRKTSADKFTSFLDEKYEMRAKERERSFGLLERSVKSSENLNIILEKYLQHVSGKTDDK